MSIFAKRKKDAKKQAKFSRVDEIIVNKILGYSFDAINFEEEAPAITEEIARERLQRFGHAKANKLKCLRHIRRLLKGIRIVARERKTMSNTEYVVTIYSKGDSLLVLAFDPIEYTSAYLMLPEEMNVSDILANLEI